MEISPVLCERWLYLKHRGWILRESVSTLNLSEGILYYSYGNYENISASVLQMNFVHFSVKSINSRLLLLLNKKASLSLKK